jgi:hypothetical protein
VSPGTASQNTTNLNNATAALTAGNTLVLNDGTYMVSSEWRVSGINGTAANPIIIEAAHDGGAQINGTGMTPPPGNQGMVYLTNSSYVIVCGFNMTGSPRGTFYINGRNSPSCSTSFCQPTYPSSNSHITAERLTAYGSSNTVNESCFGASWNSVGAPQDTIVFQDDAAWGSGCRYGFASYDSGGVTFRRDWDRNSYVTNWPGGPDADFGCYNSQHCLFENDIARENIPPSGFPARSPGDFFVGEWNAAGGGTVLPNANNSYYGDVFYGNSCGGFWENGGTAGALGGYVFKDDVIDNAGANSLCSQTGVHNAPVGLKLEASYNADGGTSGFGGADSVSNIVVTGATTGGTGAIDTNGQDSPYTPATLTNSVLMNDNTAILGPAGSTPTENHNDFSGNTSNGITPDATDKTTSPGYDTATYGEGAYLMPAANFLGQGASGADIGAHVTCEYVDGTLTHTPLWPWPMESRIFAATGISPTYSANGGLWNTLSGIPSC